MIEKQPEALRLADDLVIDYAGDVVAHKGAAELRRQHAELIAKDATIAELWEALKYIDVWFDKAGYSHDGPTRRPLLTLIAKHGA